MITAKTSLRLLRLLQNLTQITAITVIRMAGRPVRACVESTNKKIKASLKVCENELDLLQGDVLTQDAFVRAINPNNANAMKFQENIGILTYASIPIIDQENGDYKLFGMLFCIFS